MSQQTTTFGERSFSEYYDNCLRVGYRYECACGEIFKSISAAGSCRKCRNYCIFGYCTHVTDIETGEVVAGTAPTVAAVQAAVAELELKQAAAQEEELQRDEWKEFFHYETIAENLGY